MANELVGWFNSVDAQYRTELREMLDTQFRLMRSELEQRIDQRIAAAELRLDRRIDLLESTLDKMESRLLGRVEQMFSGERKWTIGLWASTMVAVIVARLV